MSILDVTEDQIFSTLGKGRDPNFKSIEKVRPVIEKPNKTYSPNTTKHYIKPVPTTVKNPSNFKTGQPRSVQAPAVRIEQTPVEPVITAPPVQSEDPLKKLASDYSELNNRVNGIQKMVKWYLVPQIVIILILVAAFILKA
jgi:hypothetical protein